MLYRNDPIRKSLVKVPYRIVIAPNDISIGSNEYMYIDRYGIGIAIGICVYSYGYIVSYKHLKVQV